MGQIGPWTMPECCKDDEPEAKPQCLASSAVLQPGQVLPVPLVILRLAKVDRCHIVTRNFQVSQDRVPIT
jgi:hypothetical protein